MNSFKNRLYFVGALLLLLSIGIIVWYALVYSQRPVVDPDGTLAKSGQELCMMCGAERLVSS